MKLQITRIAMAIGAVLLSSSIALADCPGGCPTLPAQATSGTATNNTTNNVQGVSNPSGVLVNQQNNFTTQGQVQYGNGIACQDNSINPYAGVSNSSSQGFAGYNTTTYGIAGTILIGPNHAECLKLAKISIAQHQNDTIWGNGAQCLKFMQAGVDVTTAFFNDAAGRPLCPNFHMVAVVQVSTQPAPVPVIQVIATPAPVIAAVVPMREPAHLSNFAPRCDNTLLVTDLSSIHKLRGTLKTHHPDPRLDGLEDRVLSECGNLHMINKALDG